ncbi:ribonuclease H-like domain-containing protein [Tanacetum coccineum]
MFIDTTWLLDYSIIAYEQGICLLAWMGWNADIEGRGLGELCTYDKIATESLSEYELKKILFDKMDKSRSFMTHDKYQELYDALLNSVCLDEAIASSEVNPDNVLRIRHRDKGQDPPAGSDKEKKRCRKRKDSEPSKDKVQTGSSSKGKTQSKLSSTGESVNADETIEEQVHEDAMDVAEPILDDVVNDADQPQDDVNPKKDKSTWFKQPPRPETPDLELHKDRFVDDGPEQTWFNDLVNAKKDSLTFDELMVTPMDFTKFSMNYLKKDKITRADLVGPIYKLLKGTCDRCPYDLSKPLPLQGSLGHLTIPVDFFFNNDLEYLKTGNSERKYTVSITKTKAARSQINRLSKHEVYSIMKILSMIRVKVDKQIGYGYLNDNHKFKGGLLGIKGFYNFVLLVQLSIAMRRLSIVKLTSIAAAPRHANPIGTPLSTSIEQDAPAASTSSTIQETHSLVISEGVEEHCTHRSIFIANAANKNMTIYQMDVNTAFLNDKLREDVYAPHAWYDMSPSFLVSQKFSKGDVDPTLFTRKEGKDILMVQIYVDDIISASTDPSLIDIFADIMSSKFKMSMIGKMSFFHGLQISQNRTKLDEDLQGTPVDATRYRGMIGTLMYLTSSRPDLVFEICMCARY